MRQISRGLVFLCVMASAVSAAAQTKFTGKCSGGKPDTNYVVPVGDRANHALVLAKASCTWSGGAELGGVALKDEVDTFTSDKSGATSRDRGYGVGATADGDKYFVRFEGTTTYKGDMPTSGTCTWTFAGGTGKLRGLTGKGTCTGAFDANGGVVFDIQGEYQIPPPKTK
jgi:hypothetical protein